MTKTQDPGVNDGHVKTFRVKERDLESKWQSYVPIIMCMNVLHRIVKRHFYERFFDTSHDIFKSSNIKVSEILRNK